MNKGGNLPCVMNAANEIAVYGFMKNRLGFLDMTEVIEKTMEKISFIQNPTLTQYYESDAEAREYSASLINL
jgi:1-deoxy-D-xylulose-5-phosphate reductoisomerase